MGDRYLHSLASAAPASERLMRALAEQMKLPLMQIARLSELSQITKTPEEYLDSIETTADAALRFIDSYILSNQLMHNQLALELEPVSISSVLTDTAHRLEPMASQYDCRLEVNFCGKYVPVMGHPLALEAALTSLGHVLIEAQSLQSLGEKPVITLAAHRGKTGIVAGIFAEMEGLSEDVYKRAKNLYGHAHQPFGEVFGGSAAGVFVADSIFSAMSARLRVARHHKLTGLGATLPASRQLLLV